MPIDDDYEYGSMALSMDGEEVPSMFVQRDWTKEWSRWQFSMVESLKVGPWIEGFIAFYNLLRVNRREILTPYRRPTLTPLCRAG